MSYERDTEEMLSYLGLRTADDLFADIPENARINNLDLDHGLSEQEVRNRIEAILGKNRTMKVYSSFLGAGAYDFFVPAAVRNIVGRSEFITSYTPYQPETSQGLLQALFEYQSMMCELTEMEVVNNSLYDYATGLGEAVLMAARLQRKAKTFLVPSNITDSRMSVIKNYCLGPGLGFQTYRIDTETGMADLQDLRSKLTEETIGALVESPNSYGVLEAQVDEIRQILEGRVLVAGVNAISLGAVRPPGDYGADIVIAEGQVLGNPVNFGGPMLGVLACNKKHIRKMPGRVIGLTHDSQGKRAFCMTLQTREQHIRREKATSNICSNEALTTIATASYMAYMGGSGIRRLAIELMEKSRKLAEGISGIQGCRAPVFSGPCFNEFVAEFPKPADEIIQLLNSRKINPGTIVSGKKNALLVSVSDKTSLQEINHYIQSLKEVLE